MSNELALLKALPTGRTLTKSDFDKARKAAIPKMGGSNAEQLFKRLAVKGKVSAAAVAAEITRLSSASAATAAPVQPVQAPAAAPKPATPSPALSSNTLGWIAYPDTAHVVVNGVLLGAQTPDKHWSFQLSAGGEERYEIRADEHCANDGAKTDKRRSELSGLTFPAQGLVEFAYDLLIEPQPFAEDAQYVFGQAHKGKRDPGDAAGEHPFSAFRIVQGGRPGFTVCGSNEKPLTGAGIARAKSVNVWVGQPSDFMLGQWHRVRQVLMQGGNHSWAELWIDGVRMARYDGPIGYPNAASPYWKRGVYNAQGGQETCVCRYRNVTLKGG